MSSLPLRILGYRRGRTLLFIKPRLSRFIVQTCHIIPCPKFNQIVLLMQIALSAVGTHRNIVQIWALIFPWVFSITKANWLRIMCSVGREGRQRAKSSSTWCDSAPFSRITAVHEDRVPPTLQSLKLISKDNAYSTLLYYIQNDSYSKSLKQIAWKWIFKVKGYISLGEGTIFLFWEACLWKAWNRSFWCRYTSLKKWLSVHRIEIELWEAQGERYFS